MSQDSEDWGPIVRASSKQKAEARGYKRAMQEQDQPKPYRGSLLKQLFGITALIFFGLLAVEMFFEWQDIRLIGNFGGRVNPAQHLIGAGVCALIAYGGYITYKGGLPDKR